MKASIRLQNHGCRNHPYWWIVVAPNRRNIKGRILQHVGYWAPRQGVSVDRQITLNIPRIKHWIGCGAVPTYRVQHFLALWDILPKPWYWERTAEELAAMKKPQSEWTDKDRAKEQRKRKRRERQKLDYINYHRPMAKYRASHTLPHEKVSLKLREKIHAAERENQILRDLLSHNEFYKLNRLGELAGSVTYDDSQRLLQLEEQLANAKAELALINKKFEGASAMQKVKVMREINGLVDKIREVEKEKYPFRHKKAPQAQEGEETSKEHLDKMLEYELVVKKLEKMNEDFEKYSALMVPVTLEEYAHILMQKHPKGLDRESAVDLAQEEFIRRSQSGYDLEYPQEQLPGLESLPEAEDDEQEEVDQSIFHEEYDMEQDYKVMAQWHTPEQMQQIREQDAKLSKISQGHLMRYMMTRPDTIVPTNKPVHPFPDMTTYVPEEYYEPISKIDLQMEPLGSLEPHSELDKYRNKKRKRIDG